MRNVTLIVSALLLASAAIAEPAKSTSVDKNKGEQSASSIKSPQTNSAAGSLGTSSAESPTSVVTTGSPSALRSKIFGAIDIRPSIDLSDVKNSYRLENDVELGYQFTKDTSVMYEQDFYHVIDDPNSRQSNYLVARDGFVKTKVNNIIKSGAFSFGFENRVYVPTHERKSKEGMIFEIRNYFKGSVALSDTVSLTVMSVPIAHLYGRAEAKPGTPNPVFEHRTYLVADFALFQGKLNISLPFILQSYLFRDMPGAAASGKWGHFLWINPEIMYSVSPKVAIGVSYYSDNMLVPTGLPLGNGGLSQANFWDGLKKGVPQLAFRATL